MAVNDLLHCFSIAILELFFDLKIPIIIVKYKKILWNLFLLSKLMTQYVTYNSITYFATAERSFISFFFRFRFPIKVIGSISYIYVHMHRPNSSDFSWAADSPLLLFYSLWVHTFCLFSLSFLFFFLEELKFEHRTLMLMKQTVRMTQMFTFFFFFFFTTIDAFGSLSVRILKCVKFIRWWYTKDNAPIVQGKNESELRIWCAVKHDPDHQKLFANFRKTRK